MRWAILKEKNQACDGICFSKETCVLPENRKFLFCSCNSIANSKLQLCLNIQKQFREMHEYCLQRTRIYDLGARIDHCLSSQIGAPGRIRTCDLMLRRHVLYPAELRARDVRYGMRVRQASKLRRGAPQGRPPPAYAPKPSRADPGAQHLRDRQITRPLRASLRTGVCRRCCRGRAPARARGEASCRVHCPCR